MKRIEKNRKLIIFFISLFILLLQLLVNHVCGGITLKSLLLILACWGISIVMLVVTFSSICRK